jgi:hypothetical protein
VCGIDGAAAREHGDLRPLLLPTRAAEVREGRGGRGIDLLREPGPAGRRAQHARADESAKARSRPITKWSASLPAAMSEFDSGIDGIATTPSSVETKLA